MDRHKKLLPSSPARLLHPIQRFNIKAQALNSGNCFFKSVFLDQEKRTLLVARKGLKNQMKAGYGWWNCGLGRLSLCTHSRVGSWCGEQYRNSASVQGLANTWCVIPQALAAATVLHFVGKWFCTWRMRPIWQGDAAKWLVWPSVSMPKYSRSDHRKEGRKDFVQHRDVIKAFITVWFLFKRVWGLPSFSSLWLFIHSIAVQRKLRLCKDISIMRKSIILLAASLQHLSCLQLNSEALLI